MLWNSLSSSPGHGSHRPRAMFSSIRCPEVVAPGEQAWRAPSSRLGPRDLHVVDPAVVGGVRPRDSTHACGPAVTSVADRSAAHVRRSARTGETAGLFCSACRRTAVGHVDGALDRPEHDGDVGTEPDLVREAVRFQPLFGVDLVGMRIARTSSSRISAAVPEAWRAPPPWPAPGSAERCRGATRPSVTSKAVKQQVDRGRRFLHRSERRRGSIASKSGRSHPAGTLRSPHSTASTTRR
jgi:hypothetical protein